MEVWLFRHGIALDPADPECPPDEERPLTEKGIERTKRAARGLAVLEVSPEWVLTSPLLRAVETARIAMEALSVPAKRLRETRSLRPGSDPDELFAELRRLHAERVLCVGHAPNLDRILARLVGTASPFTALRKAGAAALHLRRVEAGGAALGWILPAKALRGLARG